MEDTHRKLAESQTCCCLLQVFQPRHCVSNTNLSFSATFQNEMKNTCPCPLSAQRQRLVLTNLVGLKIGVKLWTGCSQCSIPSHKCHFKSFPPKAVQRSVLKFIICTHLEWCSGHVRSNEMYALYKSYRKREQCAALCFFKCSSPALFQGANICLSWLSCHWRAQASSYDNAPVKWSFIIWKICVQSVVRCNMFIDATVVI